MTPDEMREEEKFYREQGWDDEAKLWLALADLAEEVKMLRARIVELEEVTGLE